MNVNFDLAPPAVLALFVKFWLTTTPPALDDVRNAAQTKVRER